MASALPLRASDLRIQSTPGSARRSDLAWWFESRIEQTAQEQDNSDVDNA
jgi:hypothetical protein